MTCETVHDAISFYAGDTWLLAVTINDSNCDPLLLGGSQFSWTLKDLDGNVVASLASPAIVVGDAATARINITIPDAITALIPSGFYFDRTMVTFADGTVATESTGEVRVI